MKVFIFYRKKQQLDSFNVKFEAVDNVEVIQFLEVLMLFQSSPVLGYVPDAFLDRLPRLI